MSVAISAIAAGVRPALNAACVASGIRELSNCPLSQYVLAAPG